MFYNFYEALVSGNPFALVLLIGVIGVALHFLNPLTQAKEQAELAKYEAEKAQSNASAALSVHQMAFATGPTPFENIGPKDIETFRAELLGRSVLFEAENQMRLANHQVELDLKKERENAAIKLEAEEKAAQQRLKYTKLRYELDVKLGRIRKPPVQKGKRN